MKIKKILGYIILLHLMPLWMMLVANFAIPHNEVPAYFHGRETFFGFILGWGINLGVGVLILLFSLIASLIESE